MQEFQNMFFFFLIAIFDCRKFFGWSFPTIQINPSHSHHKTKPGCIIIESRGAEGFFFLSKDVNFDVRGCMLLFLEGSKWRDLRRYCIFVSDFCGLPTSCKNIEWYLNQWSLISDIPIVSRSLMITGLYWFVYIYSLYWFVYVYI